MEYLPFGELLVDEHLNSYNTPYKFNAKELDEETGNYYYGARYYNPKWSTWLSVDPLAEQMPEWSSYNYAFSNPVKFVDPTGMAPEIVDSPIFGLDGKFLGVDDKGYSGQIIIMDEAKYNDLTSTCGAGESITHETALQQGLGINSIKNDFEAVSNILTHVIDQMDGVDVSKLHNEKISIMDEGLVYKGLTKGTIMPIYARPGFNDPLATNRYSGDKATGTLTVNYKYISELKTVEIIQNFLGVHEFLDHLIKGYKATGDHSKAYEMQKNHPTFKQLPKSLQDNVNEEYINYRKNEGRK